MLALEENLSIQDFINNTPMYYRDKDGTLIVGLICVAQVLEGKCVLLERDCKLTESLDDAPLSDPISVAYNSNNLYTMFSCIYSSLPALQNLERFFPTEVNVHKFCSVLFFFSRIPILITSDPMLHMPNFVSI